MDYWIRLLLYIGIGYILGSIPFALVIGKVFYHKDIREYGSGNLGGSNAGRVLGKTAGIATIALDVLKVVFAVAIVSYFDKEASIWAGVAAAFGHCYPIFAKFKGGKAVATMFGFLVATAIFTFQNAWFVAVPFLAFIILLYICKMVSLSSMVAAIVSSIYISFMQDSTQIIIASWVLTMLIIYRHRSNIVKILDKSERKITWM